MLEPNEKTLFQLSIREQSSTCSHAKPAVKAEDKPYNTLTRRFGFRSFPKPADRLARKINPDALDLSVKFQRMLAHLASIPGLFVAAKRRSRVHHVIGIDPDGA